MLEVLSGEFKEQIMNQYYDGLNKEKIEAILDDFIDQHVRFSLGKKTSLERLILPGFGDLYLTLDETLKNKRIKKN